ncbi:MAG: hypothetical protein A2270_03360 [Elusimicrobia bacterium RIFOXYA12_FULL_51_18]|nr:MAG: hypothetical protein A2270_03360 [Elusimicrobia bacterium RIFOXYA12_FULL_51_18]OGS31885.1 MAG: hypothetical protein A2218_06325 [Elusimicrobia bacterium RIFOXYA2_FULL_53_38]
MTDFSLSNDKVYLLVRNPSSVFICWTWSRARAEVFEALGYEPEILVRLSAAGDKIPAVEQAVPWNSGKLYMAPPVEGKTYTAAIYARNKEGVQEKLLESNSALTPVSSQRPGLSAGYASAEFFRRSPV